MEKLFSPNRVFIAFCALLVVVWLCLQYVSNSLLIEKAKVDGQKIFDWQWTTEKVRSQAHDMEAKILKKSSTDAVVEVNAKQTLQRATDGELFKNVGETAGCSAKLIYYHTDKYWVLGGVELE